MAPARKHLPHGPQVADPRTTSPENSPKDVCEYLLNLHRTGFAISSSNLVLSLHFPSHICWMHFPQNSFLQRPNIPFWAKGDLQAAHCPALSSDWVRLHLNPLTPISCVIDLCHVLGPACREMSAHLLCKSGGCWRCHVLFYCSSSNALSRTAALTEITPARQTGTPCSWF